VKRVILAAALILLLILFAGCNNNSMAPEAPEIDPIPDNVAVSMPHYTPEMPEANLASPEVAVPVSVYALIDDNDSEETDVQHIPEAEMLFVEAEVEMPTQDLSRIYGGEFDVGRHRPIFYHLPYPFVQIVGSDAHRAFRISRCPIETETENIAVSFIRYFNISKEDFTRANEQRRQLLIDRGTIPGITSSFELYPVDLIFTFDNERINEYFLWENSPSAREFGMGMDVGYHRYLFYNMPAPFVELVGRETFIQWRNSRSDEERENENIAVSFVRYFDISPEDFNRANEEMRQVWERDGFTPAHSSIYELYPVDLIFTAVSSRDNTALNEYFLWENSQAAHEVEFSRR